MFCVTWTIPKVFGRPHANTLQGKTLLGMMDFQPSAGVRQTPPKSLKGSRDGCHPFSLGSNTGCFLDAEDLVVGRSQFFQQYPRAQDDLIVPSTLSICKGTQRESSWAMPWSTSTIKEAPAVTLIKRKLTSQLSVAGSGGMDSPSILLSPLP